jgi:hypothetical protein
MATQPQTETKSTVKPSTETQALPNPKLAGLLKNAAEGEKTFTRSFAEAVKMIKENRKEFPDAVIIASLKDKKNGRGLSEDSAQVELIKIKNLLLEKNEDRYNALQEDKITVTFAKQATGENPRGAGRKKKPALTAFQEGIIKLAKAVQDELPTMNKDQFMEYANQAWEKVKADKEANAKAVAEGVKSGLIKTQGDVSAQPAQPAPVPAVA